MLDDKYIFIEDIGQGSFGKVFVAMDALAQRKVAVKILHSTEETDQLDLINEIQFLASLNHSSIVTFFHHFYYRDSLCLVMEYCSKGSLFDKIENEGELSTDLALSIGYQIADVLEYVHDKGIIHHDIKPQNILFDAENKLRIGDFGIANSLSGTIKYVAPEVFIDEDLSVTDPRVDVYALGLTILEMLTGENPFVDVERKNIFAKKMNHSFVPITLPEWLQEIIIKATHPNPELRFQNMIEFKHALKSKSAPLIIDYKKIKSSKIVVAATNNLKRKRWGKTISYIERALEMDSNSVLALITAGRYHLKIHNIDVAQEYFERALLINPSSNVQKELAEIKLSQNNFAQALSLLQNHIQLTPTDWEAYNLIGECYYRLSRYETALELIEGVLKETKLALFWNNWAIVNYCLGNNVTIDISSNPFATYNYSISFDERASWDNTSTYSKKFLYQHYRFKNYRNKNRLIIRTLIGEEKIYEQSIISIGRNNENDLAFNNNTVSRRHCAIINYFNDVWIYDLGSTLGTFVDGVKVQIKKFLLGKHKIQIGNEILELTTSDELII
jgi:serine/threonine protein kinase